MSTSALPEPTVARATVQSIFVFTDCAYTQNKSGINIVSKAKSFGVVWKIVWGTPLGITRIFSGLMENALSIEFLSRVPRAMIMSELSKKDSI